MKSPQQPPVLITGLPRSGTTWLVHSLNRHPKILVFGETHIFSRKWFLPGSDGTYSPGQLESIWSRLSECHFSASVPLKKDLGFKRPGWFTQTCRDDVPEVIAHARTLVGDRPGPAEVLNALGQAFCAREGKSFWAEKTAEEGKYVNTTVDRMPDARFLLLMRNPIDFLRSYKYQGVQLKPSVRHFFQRRYHPLLAAAVWRKTYKAIQKIQRSHPDQTSLHILSSNESRRKALDSACELLALEPCDDIYEGLDDRVNSSSTPGFERTLDRSDIAWMRALCSVNHPEMKIPEDTPRTNTLDLLKSIPSTISWIFRFVFRYRHIRNLKSE